MKPPVAETRLYMYPRPAELRMRKWNGEWVEVAQMTGEECESHRHPALVEVMTLAGCMHICPRCSSVVFVPRKAVLNPEVPA